MSNKKVIIISGKQFSGKDTIAGVLKEYFPDFKLAPLADAIKIEFSEKKKLTYNEVDRNKPLYRADLIELGNERRRQDPDYWIKRVLNTLGNIIVSDVRFKHELDTFSKLGAIKIRVESERDERAKRGHLVKEDDPTEIDLDEITDWDFVLENNGTVEELKEKTLELVTQIKKEFLCESTKV